MSDDLDDLLRRAMKTLDDEVPSGYFEGLPDLALARLEDRMEPSSTSPVDPEAQGSPPPREEDSGLHDIRSLAQSTKMRLSSKRQSTHPPMSDEDILATSSAGWKAVALPEPAKMVSLPELDELPSKREIKAAQKKAKQAKAEVDAPPRTAEGTAPAERVEPAAAPAPARPQPVRAKPARQPAASGSKGKAIAVGAILLAAAAAAAIYITSQHANTAPQIAALAPAPHAAPAQHVTPPPPPPPAAPPVATPAPAADNTAAPVEAAAAAPATEPAHVEVATREHLRRGAHAPAGHVAHAEKAAPDDKPAPVAGAGGGKAAGSGQPKESFQQLLKEAGVDDKQYVAKPVLSRKMLSADDFKTGMDHVSGAAQACYKGTQGLASIKLVVAPSGKIQSVSVTGMFAGKPEGACVERAVRAATFPPWDGGPQTFHYSYLLAE